MIKIEVVKKDCCAYGLCAEICPDVYKLDENGIAYVENESVSGDQEELAIEGAEACPQRAIIITKMAS